MTASLVPLMLLAPVLVAVAASDLRHMRIPNALSLAAVALFVISLPWFPPDDLPMRLVVAGGVFVIGFAAFCLRLIGGGDVKILAALLLFVPVSQMPVFANIFAAALLVGIAVILLVRLLPAARRSSWPSMQRTRRFPMGISIALAGLAHPFLAPLAAGSI
ncbi:A24 family peptidase [Cereibacter sphaeroides]|uniref:A24 family peptidase n=1 Tax=Cereibacter sphaeroides TaxID=1063 RepID=UPI001F246C7C|nr:prepilin peptidase [Cereibacter sphaeroides]MCE6970000.1 prepilin peptidase [Cereibacter sphaeroides]